jgi:molybdate transport system regulatory protein
MAPRFREAVMDLTRLMLRLYFGEMMIGPGKAQLLEGIAREGSISAAGRAMGMSYKRAWQLVETMNTGFVAPVVESTRGGAQGGGAHLTETGQAVLAAYRALEARVTEAGSAEIAALAALVAKDA